jgi:hypothetical protein
LGKSGGAAGVGKRGDGFASLASFGNLAEWLPEGPQQIREIFAARGHAVRARVVKTRRVAGVPEIDVFEKRSVGDEKNGAGIFQLIADLALAIGGIEQRRNASGERGGVIGDGKFPGVGKKDGDHFSGSESGGDQAAGKDSTRPHIRESETAIAGGVDQRCLAGVLRQLSRTTS